MTTEYEGKTLWNSSSASSEVIPSDFNVPDANSSELFAADSDSERRSSECEPYETRVNEVSLAQVIY